ncbi:MAG: deoxyribodipyrimidine photo-lyase [Chloroflexi bacterium]|nr:deoxyribodipyrimidine photo-lyase [Chloroflexota bacterium]
MSVQPVIHWFRRDLRLSDNRALSAALSAGVPVIPLFVFDSRIYKSQRSGAPRLAFLLRALHALDDTLRQHNSRLLIRFGTPPEALRDLVSETNAQAVYCNDDYTPYAQERDRELKATLSVPLHLYDDLLLLAPGQVNKDDGDPFMVFTPFKKRWLSLPKMPFEPDLPPGRFHPLDGIDGKALPTLAELGFAETIAVPDASESQARRLLLGFTSNSIYRYNEGRNRLAADWQHDPVNGSSFLSPYLHLGILSIRHAYGLAQAAQDKAPDKESADAVEAWISELIWRDFYNHILFYFPHVLKHNFRREYNALQWRHAPAELQAWKAGMTGYPVVDAAMRQLNATGWMPNRARMIVASFLCKDLLIDWREGEQYFMQHLIDGDTAANNGGWQWTAGTGTDAQPYFRIFNPISQSMKFDPEGTYLRRWLPELRDIPNDYIHAPWEAPTPPAGYPAPLVEHNFARKRTMEAFGVIT